VLRLGIFAVVTVTFFLVEMGDKTQIATAALAARFHDVLSVAAGTTTGMMATNIPAVYPGKAITKNSADQVAQDWRGPRLFHVGIVGSCGRRRMAGYDMILRPGAAQTSNLR